MADPSPDTRTALLDAAEPLVLERGFGGATVDAIVERVGVSKGAFFHHFATKVELGRALVEREAKRERDRMESLLARAGEVSEDPLVQLLIALTLLEEDLRSGDRPEEASGRVPGSVRAALAYHGEEGRVVAREAASALGGRRELVFTRLVAAVEAHAPEVEVEPEALADLLEAILEGARILERTGSAPAEGEGSLLARQIARFRAHLEVLFSVAAPRRDRADHRSPPGS